MKKAVPLTLSFIASTIALAAPAFADDAAPAAQAVIQTIDTGNTAWLLVCSALVILMTHGLAFFYDGIVNL
jgi:Amt family ammonium transporter